MSSSHFSLSHNNHKLNKVGVSWFRLTNWCRQKLTTTKKNFRNEGHHSLSITVSMENGYLLYSALHLSASMSSLSPLVSSCYAKLTLLKLTINQKWTVTFDWQGIPPPNKEPFHVRPAMSWMGRAAKSYRSVQPTSTLTPQPFTQDSKALR